MALCTNCGTMTAHAADVCTACGKSLLPSSVTTATEGSETQAAPAIAPAMPPPIPKKRVGLIVMVVAAALVIGYFMLPTVIVDPMPIMTEKIETRDPAELSALLEVDLYPGAKMIEGGKYSQRGNRIWSGVRWRSVRVQFETSDPSRQVYEFYRSRFGHHAQLEERGNNYTIINDDRRIIISIYEHTDKTVIFIGRYLKP